MDKEVIRAQFGAHAQEYVTGPTHRDGLSLARLVALVGASPEWRVLDIATGAGHTAFALAPLVSRVWATDITPEMLSATRQGARERGLANLSLNYADAERLPFASAFFDLVTCRIAAHHFGDVPAFLAESARVLRPGGKLALVDNVVPSGPVGDYVNAFELLRDPGHGRCWRLDEWQIAFARAAMPLVHSEMLRKSLRLEQWAARHSLVRQGYLRAMLLEATPAVQAFFQPEVGAGGTMFWLTEGILIGQRN